MTDRRSNLKFFLIEPIEYLIKHGEVYTVRPQRSKVVEEKKVRIYYKDLKIGLGKKKRIGMVVKLGKWVVIDNDKNVIDLEKFVDKSGFKTLKEWIKAIITVNKRLPKFMQLYKVEVEEIEGEPEELLERIIILEQEGML